MRLLLATSNTHKIREIRSILKKLPKLDVFTLLQFPRFVLPQETGLTFRDNAELKARETAKALQMYVLADDSGLVVPALNGEPGILSRRYAGENASDVENRIKLLKKMESLEGEERSAYFECCISLASPEKIIKTVLGICDGRIIKEERGRNGFGYDPLFVKNSYEKTFAEIDENTKNRISHRGKALEKIFPTLEMLLT